jgi:DNA-binding MarR family transcriptional regulator
MSESKAAPAGPQETEITLGVLDAVQQNASVTQRSVAGELGIALGLANAYLKRCVRKGLIKVKQIPPNRYLYYLTPKGFAEKSRLSAEYLTSSFQFVRRARGQIDEALAQCRRHAWNRVGLIGTGELAEIAILLNAEHKLALVAIDGPAAARGTYLGVPALASIAAAAPLDAGVVCELTGGQAAYEAALAHLSPERIFTPRVLRIARRPASA